MLTLKGNLKHTSPIAIIKGGGKQFKGKKKVYLVRKEVYDMNNDSDDEDNKMVEDKDAEEFRELELTFGSLAPTIDTHYERTTWYCGAPSGAGKSTFAANIIKQYKKQYPFRKVFLFSRKPEDKVLDELNVSRIMMDEGLVDDPIDLEELKETMCVFDDCNTLSDVLVKNAVFHLISDILEVGRSYQISCIVTNHLFTDYKATRCVLNESMFVTAFPYSGGQKSF